MLQFTVDTGAQELIDNIPEVLTEDLTLTRGAGSSEVPGGGDSIALSAVGGDCLLYTGVPGVVHGAGEHIAEIVADVRNLSPCQLLEHFPCPREV